MLDKGKQLGVWLTDALKCYSVIVNSVNQNKRRVSSNESISLLTFQYIAFTQASSHTV